MPNKLNPSLLSILLFVFLWSFYHSSLPCSCLSLFFRQHPTSLPTTLTNRSENPVKITYLKRGDEKRFGVVMLKSGKSQMIHCVDIVGIKVEDSIEGCPTIGKVPKRVTINSSTPFNNCSPKNYKMKFREAPLFRSVDEIELKYYNSDSLPLLKSQYNTNYSEEFNDDEITDPQEKYILWVCWLERTKRFF